MKRKTVKRVLAVLIMAVICFTLFSFSTTAVSDGKTGSITLTTLDKESKEPISGAVFRLYYFASGYTSGDGIAYVYNDAFKDNGMDMGDFSDEYLPVHLASYADAKGIPYTEKVTDTQGRVVFDNLAVGAYLIVPAGIEDGYLNPKAFIVAVPMKDEAENKWIYNINATPKIESGKDDSGEKTYISVKKYWQSTEKTPDSITVSLIRDGIAIDSVVLSAKNNWYHRWDDLDKNHSWSVIERDVPKGYTVSYVTSQMTVVITNTADNYEEETTTTPEDTTKPDDTTKVDDTTKNDDGKTTTTVITESTTKPDELIHTGQLNWPVPVFSIAGLLLFSIGWAMLNFGKKEEETV